MKYVAISIHGSYLGLASGGPTADVGFDAALGLLRADGTGIGDPSIFERVEHGDARISLRMLDRTVVALSGDRLARSDDAATAEVFTEVWWPDDRISLRASNGMFVCAEGGGGREIVVNRPEAGEWEKFYYEQVPAELLPAEEPADTGIEEALGRSGVDLLREQAEQSRLDAATQRIDLPEPPGVSDTIRDKPPLFP
jgi:hypothetical protein